MCGRGAVLAFTSCIKRGVVAWYQLVCVFLPNVRGADDVVHNGGLSFCICSRDDVAEGFPLFVSEGPSEWEVRKAFINVHQWEMVVVIGFDELTPARKFDELVIVIVIVIVVEGFKLNRGVYGFVFTAVGVLVKIRTAGPECDCDTPPTLTRGMEVI